MTQRVERNGERKVSSNISQIVFYFMNKSEQTVIDELTEQLRVLEIQEVDLQRLRTTLRRRIRSVQLSSAKRQKAEEQKVKRHRAERNQDEENKTKAERDQANKQKVRELDQANKPNVRDRGGTTVRVGDRVTFLTRGVYRSTEGIVISTTRLWVNARDSDGINIKRSPRNVRVSSQDE